MRCGAASIEQAASSCTLHTPQSVCSLKCVFARALLSTQGSHGHPRHLCLRACVQMHAAAMFIAWTSEQCLEAICENES